MRRRRKILPVVVAGAILLGISSYASAVLIGGLDVPNGPTFWVGQIYENAPTAVGDTLAGYGKVDSINGIPVASLCTNCELTYQFSGYIVTSISATKITFTGGSYQFYLGFGADNDFTTGNAGGSAGDLAEATNGTLFLSLMGHAVDAAGNTLIWTGTNIGTLSPTGSGTALADVAAGGGVANPFLDTNSIVALFGGPADFQIGSSFSALHPLYPAECPGGRACLRGSADFTGFVTDGTAPVPEPATIALVAVALLALCARRRQFEVNS